MRKVSDTMGAVKCWPDLMPDFFFSLFFCLPDLELISQSLCKFLMMQVKKTSQHSFFLRAILEAAPGLEN